VQIGDAQRCKTDMTITILNLRIVDPWAHVLSIAPRLPADTDTTKIMLYSRRDIVQCRRAWREPHLVGPRLTIANTPPAEDAPTGLRYGDMTQPKD